MTRTLLIVDDSPISRRILKSCLPKGRNFVVAEACDGAAGLAAHREQRPDLTFLDLTMPGMNGFDCLAGIMASSPGAAVVVVTADVQKRSTERARALGAMDVIGKPPTREAVAAALERADARRGAGDAR